MGSDNSSCTTMNILFLLLCFHSIHQSISSSNQNCKCSTVKPDNTKEWEKLHQRRRHRRAHRARRRFRRNAEGDDEDEDDRIVGGYSAQQNKPWAAKLWDIELQNICGASLINKRYVLTAAHCTCQKHVCLKGKPQYTPSEVFVVYLGLNNLHVDNKNKNVEGKKKHEHGVEDVISHPDFKGTQDIALVKLDRDV